MYFPDRGCVRPLRHLCGYATCVATPLVWLRHLCGYATCVATPLHRGTTLSLERNKTNALALASSLVYFGTQVDHGKNCMLVSG